MKEGQNCNYDKKGAYKTAKRPPFKKKREKRIRGESCRFWRKPIML